MVLFFDPMDTAKVGVWKMFFFDEGWSIDEFLCEFYHKTLGANQGWAKHKRYRAY